jgi:hypothetical protein
MLRASAFFRCLPCLLAALATAPALAQSAPGAPPEAPTSVDATAAPKVDAGPAVRDPHTLVEEFTASTLVAGEIQLGTDMEVGLTDRIMLGTDVVAAAIGATTLSTKARLYDDGEHVVALGMRVAYLNKKTVLWGSVDEHFDELDARIIRPSVSWTNRLSPRLKVHTFWAKGFGRIRARLSEKGRRKLWETKHPGADYDERDEDTEAPTDAPDAAGDKDGEVSTKANQEKEASRQSSFTQQSIQVQSITGLAQDRFQMTGEISRANGNKVLVTCRIEQTEIEQLKSNFLRLTAAHQWIWSSFQMRLGIGVQYVAMSGRDLDGEEIDEDGVLPASDIGFYWRF